ncbi:MAG: hypothetical protein PHR11_05660 [Candidatus Omnitrophica bacterium]|nr:hypothetical protein [Candidatus Omnitrophota bacterium]
MKKILICSVLFLAVAVSAAYPAESKLFEVRNKMFDGAQEIKALLVPTSRDAVLLTSMFDSCMIAVSQVDAYFGMLGIFETIEKEQMTRTAVDFLDNWLNQIKKTNEMNLNFLKGITVPLEGPTSAQIGKLTGNLVELNNWVDKELVKLSLIRKSVKIKTPDTGKKKAR